MMSRIEPPICVALDTPDLERATALVDALSPYINVFKVGLELFASTGPRAVKMVHERDKKVFLDLKLSDIPNTVAGATRAAKKLGVAFLTVHSNAGRASVRAAVEEAGDEVQVLVVSVLTSLDDTDLRDVGIGRPTSAQVDAMAALAASEGASGLVLAAPEVRRIREAYPRFFLLVPGIRPGQSDVGDQRRVGTPAEVVAAGADLLVLGRAVTTAEDPVETTKKILDDIGPKVKA
jgi:orotidine-5'-phosphate decarboxylase